MAVWPQRLPSFGIYCYYALWSYGKANRIKGDNKWKSKEKLITLSGKLREGLPGMVRSTCSGKWSNAWYDSHLSLVNGERSSNCTCVRRALIVCFVVRPLWTSTIYLGAILDSPYLHQLAIVWSAATFCSFNLHQHFHALSPVSPVRYDQEINLSSLVSPDLAMATEHKKNCFEFRLDLIWQTISSR